MNWLQQSVTYQMGQELKQEQEEILQPLLLGRKDGCSKACSHSPLSLFVHVCECWIGGGVCVWVGACRNTKTGTMCESVRKRMCVSV